MKYPNTTPTPNELYNGEMKKMKDTELRVVLMVTRSTLGWVVDPKTGRRKEQDWIAQTQLIERSGRSERSISRAVDGCIKNGWIEARDKDGNLLDTSEKRSGIGRGNKIFYRLGHIFLDKVIEKGDKTTPFNEKEEKVTKVQRKGDKSSPEKVSKLRATKEIHTKETLTKESNNKNINEIIQLFEPVNPSYKQLFKNTTERDSLERLVEKHGREEVKQLVSVLPTTNGKQYAPVITTPYQLEKKLGSLKAYFDRNGNKKRNFVAI